MGIKVHGMPWVYHHDEWVKWLATQHRIPEDALYYALYGKDYKVPDPIRINERLLRMYHTYNSGTVKHKSFQSYVNSKWSSGLSGIRSLDLDKGYLSAVKLQEIMGAFTPILVSYKNVEGIVDNIHFEKRTSAAVFIFWSAGLVEVPMSIELSSVYALSRSKLLYIDHGIRIKNIMVYFPETGMGYKMKMDYKYPIEVCIEMAASGISLGGYFDRIPFESRNLRGLRIKI